VVHPKTQKGAVVEIVGLLFALIGKDIPELGEVMVAKARFERSPTQKTPEKCPRFHDWQIPMLICGDLDCFAKNYRNCEIRIFASSMSEREVLNPPYQHCDHNNERRHVRKDRQISVMSSHPMFIMKRRSIISLSLVGQQDDRDDCQQ